MSKIALKPNDSGTGTFTLESPNSNTDRTLTLPDEAGTVLTDDSDLPAGNLTGDVAAARITDALNATGSAPIYACRAWVNFNGTGTVAIRDSGNVSSITDNGTGDYTINFTTAMPDASYVVSGVGGLQGTSGNSASSLKLRDDIAVPTASNVRIVYVGTAFFDVDRISLAVFR